MHLIEKKINAGRYTSLTSAVAAIKRSKVSGKEKFRLIELARNTANKHIKKIVQDINSEYPVKIKAKDQELAKIALRIFLYAASKSRRVSDVHKDVKDILDNNIKNWGIDDLDHLI